jgi:putative transposase
LARTGLDKETGELHPLVIVSDNGPAYWSDRFATFIAARPELPRAHEAPCPGDQRRRRALLESLKYEHLYRLEVANGQALADELDVYRELFNEVRPHERLDFRTPLEIYLDPPGSNLFEAESVQET